ncbi:MAG: ATP-binding protein [Deltaproteobacteria bacterium]|nr:ATP-binding protein [Deltaproteobacteria bacterium]
MLARRRWFLVKISGRRRIGKTALVQQAVQRSGRARVLYVQIPDSDPAGVLATVRDFYDLFQVPGGRPTDLRSLAQDLARLVREGWLVTLDEFQYFHRKALFELTSHLQFEVDRLSAEASDVAGGLVVLGSIHTEMAALLEDRAAPLYNRVTDQLEVDHLDIASVLEILRAHADPSPERLLFLWNLFEGVPKFYRDCFERGVIAAHRQHPIESMFFTSSSPLRGEADNWFLGELRGRYDLVLKFVAGHPGCTNGDIDAHSRSFDPASEQQIGGYLRILRERYRTIERLQPIFAKPTARNGRFYLRDNFLRSWLSALQTAAAAVHFRPVPELVADADARLQTAEGHGLERLAATLYQERSRKGVGDFRLTQRIAGYWDKADRASSRVEIDLVALDEQSRILRLGSCKRSPDKLVRDLGAFDGHVGRFLAAMPRFTGWTIEKVAVAPALSREHRRAIAAAGYVAQDLEDLTRGLTP